VTTRSKQARRTTTTACHVTLRRTVERRPARTVRLRVAPLARAASNFEAALPERQEYMRSARERLATAAVVPLLVIAVGCSDDSGDKAGGESGSPTRGATPAASTDAPGSPQVSRSDPPAPSSTVTDTGPGTRPSDGTGPAARTLSAAQLRSALVVTADLPSGWRVSAPETEEADVTPVDKPACQPLMDLIEGGGVSGASAPHVSGELTMSGATESQYALFLTAYRPGDAEKLLRDVKAAIPSCGTFHSSGVASLTYTVSPLPAPSAGDDGLAFKISADIGFTATMSTARVGSVIVHGASQNPDRVIPPAVLKAQTDKLAAAQRG